MQNARMHEVVTEIDLRASAGRVWSVLTDLASYGAWNPTIESVDGVLKEGERLRLNLRPSALQHPSNGPVRALKSFLVRTWWALNGMSIPVRVTRLLPERELHWVGALPVPNLFEGEHFFRINERRDGGVRLTQGERYAGLLEPAFREAIEAMNRHAMSAVNRALKGRLESLA